jgi:Uma2 family endonuclease
MEATTRFHSRIVMNLTRTLDPQFLARGCWIYESTVRLLIAAEGPYFYPDVVGYRGPAGVEQEREDTLVDAVMAIEVLSPSTKLYDRTFKLEHYQKVPSLVDYLLVWQDSVHVQHITRFATGGQWVTSEFSDLDEVINLPVVGASLKLADIYSHTSLSVIE